MNMADKDSSEVEELRVQLRSPQVRKDEKLYLEVVGKVVFNYTSGLDMSRLFPEMIMAGATHDLVQKKLVYLYLSNYAESNSELALLTVNTLQKDCQDRNPMVRGLALRAMCSLRLPNLVEFLITPLQFGLKDKNGYVRKTAALGVLRLFYLDPSAICKQNFVDILYQLLRDRDPQVVSNSISALDEILASEGGMVVNTKISLYLLGRLCEFNEWGQCQVLDLLLRYTPPSEEQLFDILNVLDDRLKHANSGVVLGATRLFLHFTQDMPDLHQDVYERIHTPLLTLLGSGSSELAYTCLQHIQLLLARQPDLWSKDYHNFYCRYTDQSYVKCKKIELLSEVCTPSYAFNIVNELSEYIADESCLVSVKAIQAVGHIAVRLPTCCELCVDKLISLLSFTTDHVISETLVALSKLALNFDKVTDVILPHLPTSVLSVNRPEGRAAVVWIIGEYGESLSNTPYVLEELVDNISKESSSTVKLQLLSAVMKMFFKRPPECQEMLGRLLEHSIEDVANMDVRDRGLMYYRLLQRDVGEAQRVVCGMNVINCGRDETSLCKMKESVFHEFNTLSVMFGVPSNTFIIQECPYTREEVPDAADRKDVFDWSEGTDPLGRESSPSVFFPDPNSAVNVHCESLHDSRPPLILLNPTVSMNAKDFETQWLTMPKMREFQVHISHVPSPKELTRLLRSHFVMTMASSSPSQPVIKMFFFAQHVSTLHLFLVEVSIAVANAMLSFVLKCENPKQATPFVKHFFQALSLTRKEPPMLQWKMCADAPTCVKNVKGVFYEGKLHIGGGYTGSSKADTIVYSYNPELEMWKLLPPSPLKWFAMAVFMNQLILAGGKEAKSSLGEYTNKLATWNKDTMSWSFSLPPMLTRRSSPTAVTYEHCLAVAGGNIGQLDYSIEILDSNTLQWQHASHLPVKCCASLCTVWNGFWYFCKEDDGTVLRADLGHVMKSSLECKQRNTQVHELYSPESVQTHEKIYPVLQSNVESNDCTSDIMVGPLFQVYCKVPFIPVQITTVQGYLTALTNQSQFNGHLAVFAYFPETNSWSRIGNLPGMCASASCVVSPSGDLFLVGGDSLCSDSLYSRKLFRASINTP